MSSFRIRPHFEQTFDLEPSALQRELGEKLAEREDEFEILNFPGYLTLRIEEERQHFWSPQLNLSVEALDGRAGSVVRGLYGPSTNVWSLYLYGYLSAGCLLLVGAVLGISQWILGRAPWALWLFAGAAAVAVGLYVLAQIGQKLAAQQTFELHQAYESASGTKVEVR